MNDDQPKTVEPIPLTCPVCGAEWRADYVGGGYLYACGSALKPGGEWFQGARCKAKDGN
jgi:hypothetical protein